MGLFFCLFFVKQGSSFPLRSEETPRIGGLTMTNLQKEQITTLRGQGYGYATIAKAVGIKKDTVVAFCRKEGLTGIKAQSNDRITLDAGFCLHCGSLLHQIPGRKKVKFCSDKCRTAWWNSHPEAVNRKAVYSFICTHCGKPFTAYGNAGRKYCSHACYIADRYKGGDGNE
nr:MAG TPA: GcrA cell cycle regulator [Caudoviricetes sp.]